MSGAKKAKGVELSRVEAAWADVVASLGKFEKATAEDALAGGGSPSSMEIAPVRKTAARLALLSTIATFAATLAIEVADLDKY